jgi:PPOX class probable F420-dependent enzyme
MTATLTDEQRTFLTDHMWAVLATGRNDGSPQVSMIGYVLDEEDRLIISIKSYTAKWKNALRQPHVAVMVPDGRANATVYGTAECIETDPLRAELTADVFERLSGEERPDPTSIVPTLDEQQRTILRITADKFLFNA